jgi:hypothetical protein
MKRFLLAAFLLISISLKAKATLTISTDVVRKSAVFIYQANADGSVDAAKPLGTGFFVFVPYKTGTGGYLLLVTARHVLNPSWLGCPNAVAFSKIYLRVNLTAYNPQGDGRGVEFVPVDLSGADGTTRAFESSDPQIDGVVVALNSRYFLEAGKFEIGAVQISDFATEAETGQLSAGDSIVSAGLVPGAQGERRNYPVFKFGAISNLMDEPLFTGCGATATVPEKVWLLSVNLFPGASGSAIFYTPPGSGALLFGATVMRPCLIGVQSSSIIGADISAMTPIEPLFKIIEGLQLPNADLFRWRKPAPAPAQPPPATSPIAPAH